jgi:hypothetical protein
MLDFGVKNSPESVARSCGATGGDGIAAAAAAAAAAGRQAGRQGTMTIRAQQPTHCQYT